MEEGDDDEKDQANEDGVRKGEAVVEDEDAGDAKDEEA